EAAPPAAGNRWERRDSPLYGRAVGEVAIKRRDDLAATLGVAVWVESAVHVATNLSHEVNCQDRPPRRSAIFDNLALFGRQQRIGPRNHDDVSRRRRLTSP